MGAKSKNITRSIVPYRMNPVERYVSIADRDVGGEPPWTDLRRVIYRCAGFIPEALFLS